MLITTAILYYCKVLLVFCPHPLCVLVLVQNEQIGMSTNIFLQVQYKCLQLSLLTPGISCIMTKAFTFSCVP